MASLARISLAVAAGLAALGAAGAAGYLAGTRAAEVPQTRLTLATCGLVPAPAALDLPLAALLRKAGAPGITLGPILHPGLDAPLSVRFRPRAADETALPVHAGELLDLPVDPARLPDELRLSCRYGAVARVEYRRGPLRHVVEVGVVPADAPGDRPETAAGADPAPSAAHHPAASPKVAAGPRG